MTHARKALLTSRAKASQPVRTMEKRSLADFTRDQRSRYLHHLARSHGWIEPDPGPDEERAIEFGRRGLAPRPWRVALALFIQDTGGIIAMGIFGDRYEQPADFYGQLDPQQQQIAGQQFQQQFAQSGDPYVQQQGWGQMDPGQMGPEQLGQMHEYARDNDPSMLSRVMDHPILDAALVGLGVHEWKEHEER